MQQFEIATRFSCPIRGVFERSSQPTNQVVIFIHGLYGSHEPIEGPSKAAAASKLLIEEGIAHTVRYASSRHFHTDARTDRSSLMQAFEGKSFDDEMQDLYSVIDHATRLYEALAQSKERVRLGLHGNSLGGTMAVLASGFRNVARVSLCGSGSAASPETAKPILATFPPSDFVLEAAAAFRGDLLLIQGTLDEVVPLASGLKLLQASAAPRKFHVEFEGGNHNLTTTYGTPDPSLLDAYAAVLRDFFSGRDLVRFDVARRGAQCV